jgi:hypothetical protein
MRLATSSAAASLMLCCVQPCRANAFCHRQLQTRIAGAHQTDHHLRTVNSALFRTAPNVTFSQTLCKIELSLQSGIADLIFQKCSERDSFLRFLYEIERWLQSCSLFADLIF